MTLRVRTGSFLEYLRSRASETPHEPGRNPHGLTILSGQIVRENIQNWIDKEGMPSARLTHLTTIEELSRTLLEQTSEPNTILDGALRDRLVEQGFRAADPEHADVSLSDIPSATSLSDTERTALVDLAARLPYEEEDVRESFIEELDDYYRCTDAGADSRGLRQTLYDIENDFATLQGERSIEAFEAIDTLVSGQLDRLPPDRQPSRSHLVQAARTAVQHNWETHFGHIEWLAVASISVFDNPTLRFLAEIAATPAAPDVDLFVNHGSISYNARRIDSLPVDTETPDEEPSSLQIEMESDAARNLFTATHGEETDVPENVSFVEAPNDRRLVEHIANDVRQRLQNGPRPRDFLIVAPDAGGYRTLLEDAFSTVGVPVHVQTRRPLANAPAYRYLRSFVELIHKSERGEPLTHGELMDPLRLGYCPRQSSPDQWPLPGREFTQIEQRLHREQQRYNSDPDRYPDQGITFEAWREIIDDIPCWTAAWWAVNRLLDDVESWHDAPPRTGGDLSDLLGRYLGSYTHHTVDHERQLYEGPAIDTTRVAITETHATNLGQRVRDQLGSVGTHYDRILDLFDRDPSWETVGQSLSAVLGGETYGKPQRDRNAIPIVDAGNSFFRQADYLYILGLNANEFPASPGTPTFLHSELRRQVHDQAKGGARPYLHLDDRGSGYGEAVDFYQAALRTATADAEIMLYHTYRDNHGNDIAWSSFVDLFDPAETAKRTAVGEWLPQPELEHQGSDRRAIEPWTDVSARIAPREQLRMLLYNAHRARPDTPPVITDDDVSSLLTQADADVLTEEIAPRIDRYHNPPVSVTLSPDEPAFDDVEYTAVSGEPHSPHEMDLVGQCGLKYYYYQLLYNFEGNEPERRQIPYYSSSYPHHRLGELPYIVRENYADPRYVEKWRALVEDLLPDRQSQTDGLRQFDTDSELREWLFAQDQFDEYDEVTIYENLRAERRLVEAEVANGFDRDWDWRTGGTITIDGHDIHVPPYRADRVATDSDPYFLPIFFTRFSNRARSAFKGCFKHGTPIWEIDENCETLCIQCEKEDCNYNSKYALDHRLISGREFEREEVGNKVLGIGLQEQYGSLDGGRFVVIKSNHHFDIYQEDEGPLADFESVQARGGYGQWYDNKVDAWTADIGKHASTLDPASPIELEANERLVTEDDCLRCVYRDLCMVPDRTGVFDS